jgi:hypothetical protein
MGRPYTLYGERRRDYTTLVTLPLRRQAVQTLIVFVDLPTRAFTLMILGFHTRLVLLWAWLILLPVTVPFPHTSHRLAIFFLDIETIRQFERVTITKNRFCVKYGTVFGPGLRGWRVCR